jgi:hypothetical protein
MEATMFTGWIYDHLFPHFSAATMQSNPGKGLKTNERDSGI